MAKGKHETVLTGKNLSRIEGMARDGLTDAQIAKSIGISRSTLYEWKQRFPDFSDALKRGKDMADEAVENSLMISAMGYNFEEVTSEPMFNPKTGEPLLDENGNQRVAVTKIVKKVAHPNVTALIFWLKNRRPQDWGDRKLKCVDTTEGDNDDEQI